MVRTLSQPAERQKLPAALVIQQVREVKEFETTPHPAIRSFHWKARAEK